MVRLPPVKSNNIHIFVSIISGWHRRVNHKAGRGSLQLYVLLGLLLHESNMVEITSQLVSEEALIRHRRAKYVEMDGKLEQLWMNYDDHGIVGEDFLKEIGKGYNPVSMTA